jgi:hypothetical protein
MGPEGSTGIVVTATFNGYAGASIAGLSAGYVFVGPTATVTTTATQRLTGAAQAPLGLLPGEVSQLAQVGLCYQSDAGGIILNFAGDNFSNQQFRAGRDNYSAISSVVPGANTWKVGFCVQNSGSAPIADNDYVNGWVMVTN